MLKNTRKIIKKEEATTHTVSLFTNICKTRDGEKRKEVGWFGQTFHGSDERGKQNNNEKKHLKCVRDVEWGHETWFLMISSCRLNVSQFYMSLCIQLWYLLFNFIAYYHTAGASTSTTFSILVSVFVCAFYLYLSPLVRESNTQHVLTIAAANGIDLSITNITIVV